MLVYTSVLLDVELCAESNGVTYVGSHRSINGILTKKTDFSKIFGTKLQPEFSKLLVLDMQTTLLNSERTFPSIDTNVTQNHQYKLRVLVRSGQENSV